MFGSRHSCSIECIEIVIKEHVTTVIIHIEKKKSYFVNETASFDNVNSFDSNNNLCDFSKLKVFLLD